MKNEVIRYLDMFAGIGGFRAGLSRIPGFECIGHCEIDRHADAGYCAIHNPTEKEWYHADATTIDPAGVPDIDLLCAGFPCQSFSIAGRRKGFDDTRGTMFFEIARIARYKRPQYMLLENVPGLLSHNKGRTFAVILDTLCELGYRVEWAVLNSKDYGVPQSRRRVFIVCYLGDRCAGKILPVGEANAQALIQLIGGRQGSRVYDPAGLACTITSQSGGGGGRTGLYAVGFNRKDGITKELDTAYALNASNFRGLNRNQTQNAVFVDMTYGNPKMTEMARCLTANYSKSVMGYRNGERSGVLEASAVINPDRETVRQNGRRIKNPEEPMFALTAQDRHGVLVKEATKKGYKEAGVGDSIDLGYAGSNTRRGRVGADIAHTLDTGSTQGVLENGGRIRRLTPRECLRLQGYAEDQIDCILSFTSDSQAYKQAGNSVTTTVIYAIGLKIKAVDDELRGEAWK